MTLVEPLVRKVKALLVPDPTPSILEQTSWPTGIYSFPDEGAAYNSAVEYFNPTLVRWQGSLCLITRRRQVRLQRVGHNSLWLWRLDSQNRPFNGKPIHIRQTYFKENWEDPRAVLSPSGRLHISWTNFRWNTFAHQCFGEVTPRLTIPRPLHPVYGDNGPSLLSNKGHEKNWLWFWHDGRLHMLYSSDPHIVCETKDLIWIGAEHRTAAPEWAWGHIRGGTPPVRIGDEYWTFFHSSLDLLPSWWKGEGKPPRRQYYMAAYAFEATPPFRMTRLSRQPILRGSEADPRNLGAPLCVFPGGATLENGIWHVVFGLNDCRVGFIKIPHDDLLSTVAPVEPVEASLEPQQLEMDAL